MLGLSFSRVTILVIGMTWLRLMFILAWIKSIKETRKGERESKYEYWGIVFFYTIFDNHPVTFWYKTALSHIEGN